MYTNIRVNIIYYNVDIHGVQVKNYEKTVKIDGKMIQITNDYYQEEEKNLAVLPIFNCLSIMIHANLFFQYIII